MRCAESLRVQAYFDAEVDALSAADIERHLEHCAECRALLRDLEQVRTVLRRDSDYARASPELRSKIMRALDQEGAAEIQVAEGAPAAEGAAAPVGTATREGTAAPVGTAAPEETAAPPGTAFPMRTPRPRERVSPSWRMRPFWVGALGGVGGTAIAATFAFLLFIPRFANPLLDQLVSAHVRSLMPSHLI